MPANIVRYADRSRGEVESQERNVGWILSRHGRRRRHPYYATSVKIHVTKSPDTRRPVTKCKDWSSHDSFVVDSRSTDKAGKSKPVNQAKSLSGLFTFVLKIGI